MDSWLFLEPYYGGSHRHLADGLARRLPCPVELWTLRPHKWKWRMRSAALVFARRWAAQAEHFAPVRGIVASSLLDAAALRGLLPPAARSLPLVLYCHENQLTYPVRVDDRRDYHYGWTNIQSALAADRVLWNSAFNRDSFLEELPRFIRRMPDARPRGLAEAIAGRSEVLPVPLDVAELETSAAKARESEVPPRPADRPCRILWNHRWEHDKGPEVFFEALLRLAEEGLSFEVAVLGQAFERRPAVFERARRLLGDRVAAWGYREDRGEYLRELVRADVVVSTARHEFQGLAVLEAAACGAVPLVPDALAYREIWPEALRYREGGLVAALRDRIEGIEAWRRYDPRPFARPFDWAALLPRWIEVLEATTAMG
ncbi:MAG: DUF3524 domain-containing protein [Thermoanaerobaculia bacterium]